MFVLLSEAVCGRREARRLRRRPAQLCTEANALPFLLETVAAGAPDWEAVAAHCGRYVGRIIAPAGLSLPAADGFRRYDASAFRAALLLRSACRLLAAAALPPQALTVTLCDRQGLLAADAADLLPYAAQLRILTAAPLRYAPVCAAAIRSCGAAIRLCDSYAPCPGPELVIGCDAPAGLPADVLLLTADSAAQGCRLTGAALSLRPTHAALLPAGADAVAFAGALTACCACPDYRAAVFDELAGTGLPEAAARLRAWFAAANQKVTKI